MNESLDMQSSKVEGFQQQLLPKDFLSFKQNSPSKIAETRGISLSEALLQYTSAHTRLFRHPTRGVNDDWQEFVDSVPSNPDAITELIYATYLQHEEDLVSESHQERIVFGCFSLVYKESRNSFTLHFGNNDSQGNLGQDRITARWDDLRKLSDSIKSSKQNGAMIQMSSWLLSIDAFTRLMPPEFVQSIEVCSVDTAQDNGLWGQFLDKEGQVKTGLAEKLLSSIEDNAISVVESFPIEFKTSSVPQEVFFDYYLR